MLVGIGICLRTVDLSNNGIRLRSNFIQSTENILQIYHDIFSLLLNLYKKSRLTDAGRNAAVKYDRVLSWSLPKYLTISLSTNTMQLYIWHTRTENKNIIIEINSMLGNRRNLAICKYANIS